MNHCIDFIAFKVPPAKFPWAMLYVYSMNFKHGFFISAN